MKHSRWFRAFSVVLALSLAFSASAQGLHAIYLGAARMIPQGDPLPEVPYGLGSMYNGPLQPGVDTETRTGIWDSTKRILLGYALQAREYERLRPVDPSSYVAAENYTAPQPDPSSTKEDLGDVYALLSGIPGGQVTDPLFDFPNTTHDPGEAYPWEGAFPGGGSPGAPAVVNSHTGNRLTSVPIVNFSVRGSLDLGITLFHNSRRDHGSKWSTNLDARLHTNYSPGVGGTGRQIVLVWGDGQAVPYEFDANKMKFMPPEGFDDFIDETTEGWRVVKRDGTQFFFTRPTSFAHDNRRGCLERIEDRHGNRLVIEFEGSSKFRKLGIRVDGASHARRVTLGYYPDGRLKEIRDAHQTPTGSADNRVWTLEYHGTSQNISKVNYPALNGVVEFRQFFYNAGNITSEIDLRGKSWTATYNANNRCTGFSEPGLSSGYTFSYASTATTWQNPLGHTQQHHYSEGFLTTDEDETGARENYFYNAQRRNYETKDRRGHTWTTTVDANGNVIATTSPMGYDATAAYNADNLPTESVGDVAPSKYKYTYNSNKALTQIHRETAPGTDQLLVQVTPNAQGQPTAVVTYPGGGSPNRSTSISYDAHGYPSSVNSGGVIQSTVFSNLGWLRSTTNAAGTTSYTYDRWGRVTTITHPGGSHAVSVAYDDEDNITSITDERGKVHTWVYNDRGLPISYTNPLNQTETYSYNATGFLTSVTNGRGFTRTYAPNARGEVYRLTMPDGTIEEWNYTQTGEVASYSQRSVGELTTYTYDPDGRLITTNYGPVHTPDVNVSYSAPNAAPTMTMTQAGTTTTWTYNSWGALLSLVSPQGTITYANNNLGERTQMTDSTGATSYVYNNRGALASLTNPHAETTSFAYDTIGRPFTKTYHDGRYEQYGYDARSRLTSVTFRTSTGTNIRSNTYTYDPASNVLTHAVTGGGTTTYTYDDINQLLSETRSGYAASYTYDANGNRATRTVNSLTETYSNDAGDKLTSVTWAGGSKTFTYDGMGRRKTMVTGGVTTTYDWDAESRLISVVTGGQTVQTNVYNALDARVSTTDAAGTRTFRRDGAYVTDPVLSDSQASYTPGVSERRNGATRFLHSDLKNATSQSAGGAIQATKRYDAFGNTVASTGTWNGPFGYAGGFGYQEDPTGTMLLGHRHYDPTTGRFLSRDPAGDGRNWYTYCWNNPLVHADDDGLRIRLIAQFVQRLLEPVGRLLRGKPAPPRAPNGRFPVNHKLAGKTHPVSKVPFDRRGFPIFKSYKDVRITPTGNKTRDFEAANRAAGFQQTPEGYTWHHHQDYGRMQLVDRVKHQQTAHSGGWSIWGKFAKPTKVKRR